MFNFNLFSPAQTLDCYHCGERVSARSIVRGPFNGRQRDLCCHGCAAVLMMIEANGLTDEYIAGKTSALSSSP